jgi:Flp pilus assembly protein TadD
MAMSRFALVLLALGILPGLVQAAPSLQDATQTFKKGNNAAALEQVNAYLASKPKDAQGRFLKGLILTELNRTSEAIETFSDLTDEFPELPEPYNNLAVLYANQGQFERAKNSLEMAIRTHPAYATAHENLGDIYAKMASMAYNKALQLDKSNASAQTKLALVKELFGPPAAKAKPAVMKPAVTASPAQPTTAIETPATDKPKAPAATTTATTSTATATPVAASGEYEQVVRNWATAWSKQDVNSYLAFYVDDYAPPGTKHEDWAELRKSRLTKPSFIRVNVSDFDVKMVNKKAVVTFKQRYESNLLNQVTSKTLVLQQIGGAWKIVEEIS